MATSNTEQKQPLGRSVDLPSVNTTVPEVLGTGRAGDLPQMAQVVTLRCKEKGQQEKLQLYDIQPDGSGRLDWAAAEKAFDADTVKIEGRGPPGVFPSGEREGLTRDIFHPGSVLQVTVTRKQGTSASGTGMELLEMTSATYSMVKGLVEKDKPESKAFSRASSNDVTAVLGEFDFMILKGEDEEPLQAPPDSIPEMDPFPFWEYGNENAAAEDLAMEHKQHLQTCGVRMGRGGFAVEDLHNQNALLALRVGSRCFKGGLDCAVLPYAVSQACAARNIRVGFEHKQRQEHKDIFAAVQNIQGNKQEGTKGKSLQSNEPQAIIALVAAVHANSLPLDLILTDGEKNILLRFKGKELLQYSGLSRREAYYAVAQRLKDAEDLKVKRGRIPEDLVDQLDPMLTEAHRVLKQKIGEAGTAEGLTSQLLSVLSSEQSLDERLQTTFETILPWARQIESGIPLEIQQMYA
ncbi:hypothetical protein CVIRNUC_000073 [Coccomyxa viridis]|uniref:Uncharacterized protein n=1 Tax=Coccomyxa viridis TaxID=1274662 RepID=A0AAV1HPX0_9CHLO|nr:hypothetical protein CVIRNUC_000073 [Coccomyxa viridis]